jgi:hypothetical protein
MTYSVSINDQLGPGGLDSVAIINTNPDGSVSLVGPGDNVIGRPKIARIGNRTTTATAQSIPTSTSLTAPYTKIIFGGIEIDEVSACDPDLSTIIVPSGFSYARATSQLAAGAGTYWAGFYASRIYVDGANFANTRMPVLPGYPTAGTGVPSTNIFTQTPWMKIGIGLDLDVGSTIDVRLFQNSGGALSMPWDSTSTWFYVEFI